MPSCGLKKRYRNLKQIETAPINESLSKVLQVIRKSSVSHEGIGFHDLKMQLDYLSIRDIR